MTWRPGDRLTHRHNPALGPGRVVGVEGRSVTVEFPLAGQTLTFSAGADALVPLAFPAGTTALLAGARVTVARPGEAGTVVLSDGRTVETAALEPLSADDDPLERLARGEIDAAGDVANRLDALHLASVRESGGLGSFLGGRIRIFPHQLHAAEKAVAMDPVRWLLADEVGLGKTVEACLILQHLVRTGRAERVLVVAPGTLVVQWLGELWRKYHQVFVLVDDARLADVARDYGKGFNPFDAYRRAVVALETLVAEPSLARRAAEAAPDLLVVDEAHRLRRPPGHPGDPSYRAVAPIAGAARHALLLTATPLEEDAHGFFRLLQLLRPHEFPEGEGFEERLARPLPPGTSSTRRADIGGLPPRVHVPAEIPAGDPGWEAADDLVEAVRAAPAANAAQRKAKAERILRALASGPALRALLEKKEHRLREAADLAWETDPRVAWLADRGPEWRDRGHKTLVFVAHRETLEALRTALSRRAQLRTAGFHEDLPPAQRDIEVAQFRLPSGPSMLISTEAGGEGRNFEYCRRLVLFDLPWDPMMVEQRIGRLDRIGRARDVEIVSFRPPRGLAAVVSRLYEELGLYREPLGGIPRELARVEDALREASLLEGEVPDGFFAEALAETREARTRLGAAADRELHRDPYRPELAEGILARIPPDLDELNEEVVLAACERLRIRADEQRTPGTWGIEIGHEAKVESLPGVPGGTRFLGTFSREQAVADEDLEFFAAGHPLVEGVLAEIEDGPRGRVGLLHLDPGPDGGTGFGLAAIYKIGPNLRAEAVDERGRPRPEWAERILRRPLRTRRVRPEAWVVQPAWGDLVRSLSDRLPREPRPALVVAVRVG